MKSVLSIIKTLVIPIILLLMPVIGQAGDYEIEKVIEVGPCSGAPMTWPLKWSPDGTKLAYFNDNSLYISDTLGNYEQIAHFDLYPHRYEWLSNGEIVIKLKNHMVQPQPYKLVNVDIKTGNISILEEYLRTRGSRHRNDPNSFEGPFLTAEGRLYYYKNVLRSTMIPIHENTEAQPIVFPKSKYDQKDKKLPPEENHIIEWRKDGIYLANGSLSDNTLLASKERHPIKLPPVISKDLAYYMLRTEICRISDMTYISLDTIVTDYPKGTLFAGVLYYSFNPIFPEVLFNLYFNYDEENEIYRIGTYNYQSNTFTMIDPNIGMEGCMMPAYSSDGKKIAFWYGGNVHILYRRGV